jgi:magnesium chelatase family protein
MAQIVQSLTLLGINGLPVQVEVDLVRRLPATIIVGLPGSAIRESTHRVRSAINAAGESYPKKRVVVNLAPADLPKVGTSFDLPIAIAILMAEKGTQPQRLHRTVFVGELSLDGALKPVSGALSMAIAAAEHGAERIVLPKSSAAEAAVVENVQVLSANSLGEVLGWLEEKQDLSVATTPKPFQQTNTVDMAEVRGQFRARRALEIAAAGGHNLLMIGPPGCGKTMLACRLPTILPDLKPHESIAITRLHSVAGLLPAGTGMIRTRPFRAPHHSITNAGLMGNARLEPGEVSLAHCGVLFLDEIPEFRRSVLEILRGPLENRVVRLSRAKGSTVYPASFSLIAAANPCPCGYLSHPVRPCSCTPGQVDRYRKKLSGPMLDRIDLTVWTNPVDPESLAASKPGESSKQVRTRVNKARSIQHSRYEDRPENCNAELTGSAIRRAAQPTESALQTLSRISETHALSARAWSRTLKVARTIADLAGENCVDSNHILEASGYRLPELTT